MSASVLLKSAMTRLEAMTERERAGLAAVAAVLAIAFCFWTYDAANSAQENVDQKSGLLADVMTRRSLELDSGYRDALGGASARVWGWSIVQRSEGVAQADAVARVEAIAANAGLADARVELVNVGSQEQQGAVSTIPVMLTASFDWVSFNQLLEAIQSSDLGLIIEGVEMESAGEGEVPSMVVHLRAPFIHDGSLP